MFRIARSVALTTATTLALGSIGYAAWTSGTSDSAPAPLAARDTAAAAEKDIVDTAVAAGKFKTLAAALQAAGLVETLKGDGPFTVFAPTDAAFAKLPAGTVDALLKDKKKLTEILTYHVVPGRVIAAGVDRESTG